MIYKILNKEEIGQLKEELSLGLPGTAKIYYVIRNALDDKLSGFEVIVDNWPKWNCILLRPESTDKVLNYFRQTHICHTKSVSALKYFLQRPGLISWNQPINFTGVPSDVIPVLSEVCRKHGGQITSKESRLMYAWSKSSPPDMPKIPEGVTLSSLKPEHAKILKRDWAAKQGNAVELEGYFQSVIEKFESSCLLDSNGRILAYICMQYNGSIAMIYVLPEFRKEGYFDILISDLTRKLLAKQDIAYGFIPFTDTSLINLSRELGFEWVPQGNMTWTRYTPNVHQRRQKAASESDVSDVFSNNLDTLLKSQLGIPLVNI